MEIATILTSSLLSAGISAGVSAWISIVLKNKDYRNDYYKRIIEKRLKAIEAVESVIHLFANVTHPVPNGAEPDALSPAMFTYFIENPYIQDGNKFSETIKIIGNQIMWLSIDSDSYYKKFCTLIFSLQYQATYLKTSEEAINLYLDNQKAISNLLVKLELSLGHDMANLYDVEAFLAERQRLFKHVKGH